MKLSIPFAISLSFTIICSCKSQPAKETIRSVDTSPKVAPENLHFTAHKVEQQPDGSRAEIDTTTGFRRYYYKNGKLQMTGKVTKATPKDYRDGIWSYYNEAGQLMNQETYTQNGKENELNITYFTNGKPLSRTYQYYEGEYKNKETFKFHKIETMFYVNGKHLAERHWINNNLVDEKCWDAKGNPKPISYLNSVKPTDIN